MTEHDNTTEANTDAPTPTVDTDQPIEPADTDTNDKPGTNREAKYRRALREVEAERDKLAARLEVVQRADAERLSGLAKPAALWAAGVTMADLADEHGNLDPVRVAEAAQRATDELGASPAPRTPRPDASQGARGETPGAGTAWVDAFAERRTR